MTVNLQSIPHAWRPIMDQVKAQGGSIEQRTKHLMALHPDGAQVTFPGSPSDRRALRNTVAELRRAGFVIDGRGRFGKAIPARTVPAASRRRGPVPASTSALTGSRHLGRGERVPLILAFLNGHPWASVAEIASALGMTGDNVQVRVGQLVRDGVLLRRHIARPRLRPVSQFTVAPSGAALPATETADDITLPPDETPLPVREEVVAALVPGLRIPAQAWRHLGDAFTSLALACETMAGEQA